MLEEESLKILGNKGLNPIISTFASKIKAVVFILLDNMLGISIIMGLIYNTLDTYIIIDSCNAAAVLYQVVSKQIVLLIYRKEFSDVIYCVKKFWSSNKFGKKSSTKIHNIQYIVKKLLHIFKLTVLITTILYLLKPLMEGERVLPFTWMNFCNIERGTMCYVSSYILQICGVIDILYGMVGFDSLFFILLSYGYCELEQVKYAFLDLNVNLSVNGDEIEVLQKIGILVRQHDRVLIFLRKVNKLFTNLLLCQFLTSVTCLCTGLFLLTAKGFPPSLTLILRYVPYIFTALSQICIYCTAGQIIGDQSESVANAAFETYWWTKRQPLFRRSIILIIERAQRRTQISAGGVFKLDMTTFVSILRGSVSALTLMQTFYNDP
uniref:Odorant receptor n=1 Tax=Holotrichia parallela TaxID=93412 RepID=A0A2P9JY58_HOLPA|nr:odorant receptor 19 [Holotrichia parallela]